jgi:hypothetical protein
MKTEHHGRNIVPGCRLNSHFQNIKAAHASVEA